MPRYSDDFSNENFNDKLNNFNRDEIDDASASSSDFILEKSAIDKNKIKEIIPLPLSKSKQAEENEKLINDLHKNINERLDLDGEIASLNDKKKWKGLFDHLKLNFKDYFFDGKLSIQLHIRYFLCCYIIAFIPADFVFFYPAAWQRLLPEKVMKVPIFGDALREYKIFEKFVKDQAGKKFIVTFYFGRKNTLIEDLKFLVTLPDKIYNDPGSILRELLEFEITSEGYADFKKEYL
ncbi:hypothetical protein GVAV_002394 [Gurleya vavrai]